MSHLRLAILLVLCLRASLAGAADGGVHLYLQPLPPEATRLTFTIGSIAAIPASGPGSAPLDLRLNPVRGEEATLQRLLASGRVPIGTYAGFAITITQASLKNGRDQAALAVPETTVRLDVPFVVAASQASVIWLALDYADSVRGVAFSPSFSAFAPPRPIADHTGFVSNTGSNSVTVFDKNLEQAVGVIETCAGPAGMALDQRRRRLYVACSKDDEIQSIDVATGDIVERTRLSPGDRPRELALTPDGTTLLSVNAGSNSVSIFDAFSVARRGRLSVGSGPGSIVIDPAGTRAFVSNTLSSTISVIDLASQSVAATLSTDGAPLRAVFNRRGDRLYVIHERSPYLTVLDPQQLTTVTRARLRIGVSAIAVDSVRDLVCIGGEDDTTIDFYDPNALLPLYSMRVRAGVSFLVFDAQENNLYMVSPETRGVGVARLSDRKIQSWIDVGEHPYAVAVMGER